MPLTSEINVPPPPSSGDSKVTKESFLADIQKAIAEARKQGSAEGVKAERQRILRARNEVFAGVVLDDAMQTLLQKFDRLLLSGEDPHA